MTADRSELKARLRAAVDGRRDDIVSVAEQIWAHPEPGYKEHGTAALVAETLRGLGLEVREGLALTGVRADIDLGRPGPTVAIMGELDALPVPDHPAADPASGAVHACGHHSQIAHLVGTAMAIRDAAIEGEMAGRIAFIAVPAEEYVQLDWRMEQARAGRIEFLGGKAELVRLGVFDDIDMAMFVHATSTPSDRLLSIPDGSNGFVVKKTRFEGRAAHAGAAPHQGVNALNAATLALDAVAMQRETFRDQDRIRVHGIITHGGSTINVVPAEVRLEMQVRALTLEAMQETAAKVDRCMRAGALAVGGTATVDTLPGYLPLRQDPGLGGLFRANAIAVVGSENWVDTEPTAASTDAGDLSHLMPLLHPSAGGFGGSIHGADFHVTDQTAAYLYPTLVMAMTLADLLGGDASGARAVLDRAGKPPLTREGYLALMRSLFSTVRYDDR
jgi:amidohydrolase